MILARVQKQAKMQVCPGSLLIANPAWAYEEQQGNVVYITESTDASTMGLILNSGDSYSMSDLLSQKGISWPWSTQIGIGGDYSPTCLIMLHSNDWYSSNTMPVDKQYSISSDGVMLEKLEDGNTPNWFKMFIGTSGWTPNELEQELRADKPKWLLLTNPSYEVINASPLVMWNTAIDEYSQDVFNSYF